MPLEPIAITEPHEVGRSPTDAYIGLSLMPDGEIRHYDYGQQREEGQEHQGGSSRPATGWLSSRDDGESWQWREAPDGFVGADVRSPVSGEWIRLFAQGDGVYCAKSQGALWRTTKVLDERASMLKPPIFIRGGNRILVGAHSPRRQLEPGYRHELRAPQRGCGVLISDDDGRSWHWSQQVLAPDHEATGPHRGTRWNHGAVEPSVVELTDGRLWMLIRTAQDRHYESFSADGGETWEPAQPSRFHATCTMPSLGRLRDGRLLLLWNNTTPLPELVSAKGQEDVFTNRDAIHAAISDDDGKTWRGFREIGLNELRHDEQFAQTGGVDRSVQQSQFIQLENGNIIASIGQHWLCRQLVKFHPDWLLQTERVAVFDTAMSQFSTQSYIKGIQGHCSYDRKPGAAMIEHPEDKDRLCLHIRRRRDPDLIDERGGAVWNFPATYDGCLQLRIRLMPGFGGTQLTLTDRWFNPIDPNVHEYGPFSLEIPADGRLPGGIDLKLDRWHELRISWERVQSKFKHPGASFFVDAQPAARRLGLAREAFNGLSYLHLVSTAAAEDAGLLIDSIQLSPA